MIDVEGGELLVAALAARGVERLFSVSGGPVNSIYMAADRSEAIDLHHVRHEGAAGFMADATARVTGVPGVAVVTLGPGVTNVLTPLATAGLAGSPVLVIGGQAPISLDHRGAGMAIDVLPSVAPLTKFAARVSQTERIPEYVDIAWRHMLAGQPGPAYLEIPTDVLHARADSSLPVSTQPAAIQPSQEALEDVREALVNSARPVVLLGDDVRWSEVPRDRVARLAEVHNLPVAPARMARGAIPEQHSRCLGPGYVPCNPALRAALAEADTVLLLGHTFDFDLAFGDGVADEATVVQVHRGAELLGRNRPVDLALVANTGQVIDELLAFDPMDERRDREWVESMCGRWHDHRTKLLADARAAAGDAMHPLELVEEVFRAAPDNTTFVTSHGNIDFWADAHLQPHGPTRYLRAGQAGTLGAEVPFGVAASLAHAGEPVIVFVGDGGVGYHALELDTAVRYDAPVIIVVADDNKWGAISEPQRMAYGREVQMDLPSRDWVALARSLGAGGERVDRPEAIKDAVDRAISARRPWLLHAPIKTALSPYMEAIS